MTEHAYVRHLRSKRPLEVVALYDPCWERASRVAHTLGLSSDVLRFENCLAPSVRGVLVCTPPDSHLSLLRQFLDAGKYVLCEKPVVRDRTEIDALMSLPGSSTRLMGSASTRLRQDVQLLLSWVRQGRIGDVRRIRLGWWRERGVPLVDSWRTNSSRSPAGVLEDLGPHLLDIAAVIFPPVSAVVVRVLETSLECRYGTADRGADWLGQSSGENYVVPDFARAVLSLSDGPVIEIEVCWACKKRGDLSRVRFEGSKGVATFQGLFGFSTSRRIPTQSCALEVTGSPVKVHHFAIGPNGQEDAFRESLEIFARFCKEEGRPVANLAEVCQVASWMQSIRNHPTSGMNGQISPKQLQTL